jgi:acylpyruvate hydrolase
MRLATVRRGGSTQAVRLDGDQAVSLSAGDLGEFLQYPDWRVRASAAEGERFSAAGLDYAPLVPRPDKVVCVGLNYRPHILEMGGTLPEYPTLFAKYRSALIGAYDDLILPLASEQVDWEAELAVVVGQQARHVSEEEAGAVIAGYTVLNDGSVRDFQHRTLQWLQGKTFGALPQSAPGSSPPMSHRVPIAKSSAR